MPANSSLVLVFRGEFGYGLHAMFPLFARRASSFIALAKAALINSAVDMSNPEQTKNGRRLGRVDLTQIMDSDRSVDHVEQNTPLRNAQIFGRKFLIGGWPKTPATRPPVDSSLTGGTTANTVRSIEPVHMKNHCISGRFGLCAALGLIGPVAIQAQVIITAADMFNQPGQYYKAYANATNNTSVSVSGMLGNAGGPQLWDFTSGPSEVTYRFDYLAATNAPHSTNFVAIGARMAEQKTDESGTVSQAWLYFTQDPARGRVVYGFYDPGFNAGIGDTSEAQGVFRPPLNDFPATIQYGATWSSSTSFTNTITFGSGDPDDPTSFSWVLLYAYSATAVADAYGTANSPGIGFGDCLRVNELVTYDLSYDDGSGFQPLGTFYVRNYYWLRPGRGIVAQVNSTQTDTLSGPPPDNFSSATAVVRMFETNHPDPVDPGTGGGIQGLKLTLGPSGALLQWTALASVTSYRVEYKTNLGAGWQSVGTTTGNFLIDSAAGKPNTPMRFYRVVGLP